MRAVLAVMMREYLIRRTSVIWFFLDLAVPLLYLLMFGVGFDAAMGRGVQSGGTVIRYNEFFLASVLAMACFGSAINQSYGFFVDRDNGIFYEFLTYPMTRGQLMLGKILYQGVMSLLQLALVLLAATLLLGARIRMEFIPLAAVGMLAGISGWFFFLAIFAFLIRRNDTFNTVLNVLYFVLMFLSSLFYPLEDVPGWLHVTAMLNPLTWQTDVLRFLTVGVGNIPMILAETALFGAFLVISFLAALRALKRGME